MVQRASSWLEMNRAAIGWLITGLIYGLGIFSSLKQDVNANNIRVSVQEERINNLSAQVSTMKETLKEMNVTLQRIDKNTAELNVKVDYKK